LRYLTVSPLVRAVNRTLGYQQSAPIRANVGRFAIEVRGQVLDRRWAVGSPADDDQAREGESHKTTGPQRFAGTAAPNRQRSVADDVKPTCN
jgi:hypothetical protein